jgi:hypothetical protein
MLAASTIPWWGAPLFALLGGIVGGLITQGINVWNDKVKHTRERQVENLKLEREAAVRFAVAVDEQILDMFDGEVVDATYMDREALLAYTGLRIVCSPEVVVAAEELTDKFDDLLKEVHGRALDEIDGRFQQQIAKAREGLFRALRRSQGFAPIQ